MPRSISLASATPTGRNSTPNDGATDWIAPNCPMPRASAASRSTADSLDAGCDLLQQLQPFRAHAEFERNEPGGVAARPGQALDITGADRVGNLHEHDGHHAGCLQQRTHADTAGGQDHVRRERDQFRDISAEVGLVPIPAVLDLHVAAVVQPNSCSLARTPRCAPALRDRPQAGS